MKDLELNQLENWYKKNYQKSLKGRWITYSNIEPILKELALIFDLEKIGESFNKVPINAITIGTGKIKILIWSQMHGNESTGTKAIFDLFKFFKSDSIEIINLKNFILNYCTLTIVPMLNPDGALAYTRVNAQLIDLNRDAVDLKSPESKVLRTILERTNPDFCFNLHDQRTIFSVGNSNKPATISFLAPSVDKERSITEGRKQTMCVIAAMNKTLQEVIPNQIGRYTDEFYPKATGDNFQKEGYNTILIEAGHYIGDYNRELTRKYNFYALISGLCFISSKKETISYKDYFKIPNNSKNFIDILYKNILLKKEGKIKNIDVGMLFKEKIIDDKFTLQPHIELVGDLNHITGDAIIDKKLQIIEDPITIEKLNDI